MVIVDCLRNRLLDQSFVQTSAVSSSSFHVIALLSDPHKGLKAIMKNILSDSDTAQKIMSQIRPRFGEWSMACANLQLKKLVDNASGPCFHYMGLFLNDDSQMMSKSSGTVTGLLMSKWWDQVETLDPKDGHKQLSQRPCPTWRH